MKNIIISLMAGYIISNFGFWQYMQDYQQIVVAMGMALLIFAVMIGLDEHIEDYRRKKKSCEELKKTVEKLTNDKREN